MEILRSFSKGKSTGSNYLIHYIRASRPEPVIAKPSDASHKVKVNLWIKRIQIVIIRRLELRGCQTETKGKEASKISLVNENVFIVTFSR